MDTIVLAIEAGILGATGVVFYFRAKKVSAGLAIRLASLQTKEEAIAYRERRATDRERKLFPVETLNAQFEKNRSALDEYRYQNEALRSVACHASRLVDELRAGFTPISPGAASAYRELTKSIGDNVWLEEKELS